MVSDKKTKKVSGDGWELRGKRVGMKHVAALQGVKWMGRSANTRLPAFIMILGYPMTVLVVFLSVKVLLGITVLASVIIWHVSYRSVVRQGEHASKRKLSAALDWSFRLTALAPTYTAWILLAQWATHSDNVFSMIGHVFSTLADGWWFLGYATGCTVVWLLIFRAPHVIETHNTRQAAKVNPFGEDLDMEGTRVVRREPTRTGERWHLDISKTGKAASDFVSTKLREKIAAKFGLPAKRVLITPVDRHAGRIEVSIRRTDPWAEVLVHPMAPEFKRKPRKISQPIVLGLEPEEGKSLTFHLMTKEGGQHVVIIAGTRGGKTTLVNSILEHLTDCADTDVSMIDVTKGKDGRAWAPAVAESLMGPDSTESALLCLERHVKIITDRAAVNQDAVWRAGKRPADRAKVIVLDEASALLSNPNPFIADRAKAAVGFILSKGASELVIIIIMAQRGVLTHLGTGDVGANTFMKIMLGVSKKGEMGYVIPDWEALGMPDMSKYGDGRKGVVLMAPVGQPWSAGRTWDLSDLDTVRRIAASRTINDDAHRALVPAVAQEVAEQISEAVTPEVKPLRPWVGDLVTEPPRVSNVDPDPDDPDSVINAPWMDDLTLETPRELTPRERAMLGWGSPSGSAGWKPVVDPRKAVTEAVESASETLVMLDHALVQEMSRPADESAHRWAMRELATAKVDQDADVPAEFVSNVLKLAGGRPDGVSRLDVEAASGLGKTVCAERLRIMTNRGLLTAHGAGRARRYTVRVPENAGDLG
jgi:hypothetical protein